MGEKKIFFRRRTFFFGKGVILDLRIFIAFLEPPGNSKYVVKFFFPRGPRRKKFLDSDKIVAKKCEKYVQTMAHK